MSEDLRDKSRRVWQSDKNVYEDINCGSLQRIADAVETMAKSYDDLRKECDYWKERHTNLTRSYTASERRASALRGVITKLKRSRP